MALIAPNPLLATDSVTTDPRATTKGIRADLSYADRPGSTYPAVVTQQTSSGLRVEIPGQPMSVTRWDILIFSETDPGVKKDHVLTDQNGRKLVALIKSVQRETGCYYVQAQGLD